MSEKYKKLLIFSILAIVLGGSLYLGFKRFFFKVELPKEEEKFLFVKVGNKIITKLEFISKLRQTQVKLFNVRGFVRGADMENIKMGIFRTLIHDKLLEISAEDFGVRATKSDIDKKIKEFEKIFPTPQVFKQSINLMGYQSIAQLRQDIKYEVLENKLTKKIFPNVEVTNEEIRSQIPSIHLQQIIFMSGSAPRTTMKEQAEIIYKKLLNGADFSAMAKKHSGEIFAAKGGDIGWVYKSKVVPKFWHMASSLKVGEISQPFETDFGFHILKCIGKLDFESEEVKKTEKQVRRLVEFQKRQALFYAWFKRRVVEFEQKGKIQIFDPYILAIKYTADGKFEKAIEAFEEASNQDPNNPYIRVNIGKIYLRRKEYDKAFDEFKKATEIAPQDPNLFMVLGISYMDKGELDKGKLEFEKASELAKLDYQVHLDLKNIYSQLGMLEEANREQKRFLDVVEALKGGRFGGRIVEPPPAGSSLPQQQEQTPQRQSSPYKTPFETRPQGEKPNESTNKYDLPFDLKDMNE